MSRSASFPKQWRCFQFIFIGVLVLFSACSEDSSDADSDASADSAAQAHVGTGMLDDLFGDPAADANGTRDEDAAVGDSNDANAVAVTQSFDKNGLRVSEFSGMPKAAFRMEGPSTSTAIASAAVDFDAGTLSISNTFPGDGALKISLEQSMDLTSDAVMLDLGLYAQDIDAVSVDPGVLVIPSMPVAVANGGMVMSLPYGNANLVAATEVDARVVILYKQLDAVTHTFTSGLIPATDIVNVDGNLQFDAPGFGAYQVVTLSAVVTEALTEPSSNKSLRNIQREDTVNLSGAGKAVLSLRPRPRGFYINKEEAASWPLSGRCSRNGDTIEISGAVTATTLCQDYTFSETLDFSGLADGAITLTLKQQARDQFAAVETTTTLVKDTLAPTIALDAMTTSAAVKTEISGAITDAAYPWKPVAGSGDFDQPFFEFVKTAGPGDASAGSKTGSVTVGLPSLLYFVGVSASGVYTFRIKVSDPAGNLAEKSFDMTFAFDVTTLNTRAVQTPTNASLSYSNSEESLYFSWETEGLGTYDNIVGWILVRRAGEAVDWLPVDGQSYTLGALGTGHHLIAQLAEYPGYEDTAVMVGQTYHYAVYEYDVSYNYSAPGKATYTIPSSTYNMVGYFGGDVVDLEIDGNILIAAKGTAGIDIYSIAGAGATKPKLQAVLNGMGTISRVTRAGNYAYLAADTNGVQIVSILDPTNPQLVATLKHADMLGVNDVFIATTGGKRFAYIADGDDFQYGNGLFIYDVTVASQPLFKGTVRVDQRALYGYTGLTIDGNYAYLVSRSKKLHVYDIQDKSDPNRVVNKNVNSAYSSRIVKSGNSLHITEDVASRKCFMTLDVTDPENPGELAQSCAPNAGAGDLLVYGSHIYFANKNWGVRIYTAPGTAAIATIDTTGSALAMAAKDDLLYIADERNGIVIRDITTPASPTVAGAAPTMDDARDIKAVGNTAYVVGGSSGLLTFDVTVPTTPVHLGTFVPGSGYAMDMAISGSYLFLAADQGGLHKIDISDPNSPTSVDSNTVYSDVKRVLVDGSHVFVLRGTGRVEVLETSDLSVVGSVVTDAVYFAAVANNTLYVTTDSNDIAIYDVSNRATPVYKGRVVLAEALAIAVSGTTLFVSGGASPNRLINLYDLTAPYAPALVKSVAVESQIDHFAIKGTRAYASANYDGLIVVDFLEPQNAFITTIMHGSSQSTQVKGAAFVGAYVLMADDGLTVHNDL